MSTVVMNEEIQNILRAPFSMDKVGKLPRIWCRACRDAAKAGRACGDHTRAKCDTCRNTITDAHLHLDYVGHADVTDRLLQADPEWTWEPVAFSPAGLPLQDGNGGLWIRLTVAGVTRLGYGDAAGKTGADAVKEAIGDGLRNAAMRFGVALDLWRKELPPAEHDRPSRRQRAEPASEPTVAALPTPQQATAFDNLLSSIKAADTEKVIANVGQMAREARGGGRITRAQYDRLDRAAAHRLSELNGGAA